MKYWHVTINSKKFITQYSEIVDFSIPLKNRNDEGRGLVVFNSSDFLEIAMYKSNKATVGGASTLMGLEMMDSVTVLF